jgi:hypothetical protein
MKQDDYLFLSYIKWLDLCYRRYKLMEDCFDIWWFVRDKEN